MTIVRAQSSEHLLAARNLLVEYAAELAVELWGRYSWGPRCSSRPGSTTTSG